MNEPRTIGQRVSDGGWRRFAGLAAVLFSLCGLTTQSAPVEGTSGAPARWVASWSASATGSLADAPVFKDQTLRQIVHLSAGGDAARVQFSNQFGTRPLVIGAAHIAVPLLGSIVRPGSDRTLRFNGRPSVTIPPGETALSDAVAFHFEPLRDIAVSIYLPDLTPAATAHWAALQTSYVVAGDRSGWDVMWPTSTIAFWPFLARLDLLTPGTSAAIVAFGDSITDGAGSRPDTNRRWPDVLAERLLQRRDARPIAVVNAGISGNRLLHDGAGPPGPQFGPSALSRFDRDVLSQPGAKYAIVLEGINDVIHPGVVAPLSESVTPDQITAGLLTLIQRAHAKDLQVFGVTLLPFGGSPFFTQEREAKRQTVNRWIRESRAFDTVVDGEKVLKDPARPSRLLPRYDSGDHIHLSDAGYRAMAEAVDLSLFMARN